MGLRRKSAVGIEYINRLQAHRRARSRAFSLEPLETRVLPSGVGPFPISKAKFLDADGDKVKMKLKGGDQMVVELVGGATNNADVATITLVPGKLGVFTENSQLTISVKPAKKIATDGIVEIFELTQLDAAGVETFGGLNLTNVLINNVDLPGNLTRINANNSDFGNVVIAGTLSEMIIGKHDLTGTIHANAIGTVKNVGPLTAGDIAGNIISDTSITEVQTNRITGSVTAGTTLGTLATVEDLDGLVQANSGTLNAIIGRNLDGSLINTNGNINLGTLTLARVGNDITGIVQAGGTATVNAEGDIEAGASISSTGNLTVRANSILSDITSTGGDVTFAMSTGGLGSAVIAGGSVFGNGSNNSILIRGGDLSGQILAGENIADVRLDPDTLGITGSLNAGAAIGNLVAHFFSGATVNAGTSLGNITVDHEDSNGGIPSAILNSSFSAGTTIGTVNVTQTGGESAINQSTFTAGASIASVTATTTGTGSAIIGSDPVPTFSAGTSIGNVNATSESGAAISSARFDAVTSIANVTATSTSGDAIDDSTFNAINNSIANVTATSTSGKGIDGSTFSARTAITSITGTSETDEGINESTFRATTGAIGSITGRSTDEASTADGISDSNFTSGSTMGAVLGQGQLGSGIAGSRFSAGGSIASINGTTLNEDTGVNEDGIQDSVFRSGADIGKISGSTGVDDEGLAGATESEAIDGSTFSAFGSILSTEGASIETEGDIQNSLFFAGYDIGGNLVFDGLAGPGSDDIRGSTTSPVQIGDISVGSDIVASFFASGVGTDNAILGDAVVGALDDFLNSPGSSIGDITVNGVIAGQGGFTALPRAAFSSDIIGLIEADAIGMSDEVATGAGSIASVGINTTFFLASGGEPPTGTIEGITVETSTRSQAIGDGTIVSVVQSVGFLTATNLYENAVSAVGTGFYGTPFIFQGFIGDITASAPNAAGAVALDGRGLLSGDPNGLRLQFDVNSADTNLSVGNIEATVSNLVGSVAIQNMTVFSGLAGANIGALTTVGNVVDSAFGDPEFNGDVANVAGKTGINVRGNIVNTAFAGAGSIAGDGGINVTPIAGEEGFISGSSFTAGANGGELDLAIGALLVTGRNDDGAAVTDSFFSAPIETFLHIGDITLTAGSLENSTFETGGHIALEGGIFVHGNTVHQDFGIANSSFSAGTSEEGGDIGGIVVGPSGLAKNTVGTSISNTTFSANNIAVSDDDHSRAIIVHGNNTGSATNRAPGEAGLSIIGSSFTTNTDAGLGSIGDVLIAQGAGDQSGGGIADSNFEANVNLGDVRIRIHVTDADEDVSAISNSTFRGQSIDGEEEFGSLGEIEAIVTGLPSTADVITNSTFIAGPDPIGEDSDISLGDIVATTQGTGAAVSDSTFRTGAAMGSFTAESGAPANDAVLDTVVSSFGSIGSGVGNDIGVIGNVLRSMFLAGYDIGSNLAFDGSPLLSNDEDATPGTEQVNVGESVINRVSVNGNFISSDLIVGINPGDSIFGNTQPLQLDPDGNPVPGLPGDDSVASENSFLGTVQVQGGVFTQGDDPKDHSIAAGFIAQFQQPSNVNRTSELPGFLDNGGGDLDVRIQGAPSGVPVFVSSRDYAGREVDFNFDGDTDIILLDSATNQLKIFLGNGDGTFSEPQVFTVGTAPVAAVIGNFNGDFREDEDGNQVLDNNGDPIAVMDIIVLNSLSDTRDGVNGSNTIDIFLGDKVTGAFMENDADPNTPETRITQNLGFGSRTLTSIVASDWVDTTAANAPVGDGILDLLITNETNDNARLLSNDGNAVFTATQVNNPFTTGGRPTGASATPPLSLVTPEQSISGAPDYNIPPGEDLDGANGPDLVVANSDDNTVSIFLGNTLGFGTGQFSAATTVAVGTTPLQTILGDVDDDGDVDILATNFGSNNVTVLFNDGIGNFGSSATIAVGDAPRSIIVGFFDGDQFLDFATADAVGNSVTIVLNVDGTFTAPTIGTVALVGTAISITSGDYDGDNDIDLAVTDASNAQAPEILLNDGSGNF